MTPLLFVSGLLIGLLAQCLIDRLVDHDVPRFVGLPVTYLVVLGLLFLSASVA